MYRGLSDEPVQLSERPGSGDGGPEVGSRSSGTGRCKEVDETTVRVRLEHLASVPLLRPLDLTGTGVTEAGVERLRTSRLGLETEH